MSHTEMVIGWLNDAHALEQNLIETLEKQAKSAKDHPQMQTMLQQHLEETRRHAELVKSQIERLGGDVSTVKSTMSKVMGTAQGLIPGAARDEMIKHALQDYSSEHMEIGSYRSLMTAGEQMGDQELVQTCRTILQDEENMARFLEQQIPMITQMTLQEQMQKHMGQGTSQDMTANP